MLNWTPCLLEPWYICMNKTQYYSCGYNTFFRNQYISIFRIKLQVNIDSKVTSKFNENKPIKVKIHKKVFVLLEISDTTRIFLIYSSFSWFSKMWDCLRDYSLQNLIFILLVAKNFFKKSKGESGGNFFHTVSPCKQDPILPYKP